MENPVAIPLQKSLGPKKTSIAYSVRRNPGKCQKSAPRFLKTIHSCQEITLRVTRTRPNESMFFNCIKVSLHIPRKKNCPRTQQQVRVPLLFSEINCHERKRQENSKKSSSLGYTPSTFTVDRFFVTFPTVESHFNLCWHVPLAECESEAQRFGPEIFKRLVHFRRLQLSTAGARVLAL